MEEKRKLIKLNNEIIQILHDYIGVGEVSAVVKDIVDNCDDPELVNTAKYMMYWVEKASTIDDPEINKYNDYKEVE